MRKEIQKVSPQKKDQIEDVEAGALKMLRVPWLFDREDSLLDEVIAWIWYDVANSNYSSVSMATFLPLLLNSYATTIAWKCSGEDAPPYCSDLESKYSEACIECRVGEGDLLCTGSGTGRTNCDTLDVPTIGGLAPSSFAFFIISMSCISQLLSFMVWGQSGDYSDNRRLYLMISSVIGAASLICFAFFPVGEAYAKHIIAAILTITCNTSFGLAQIFYNAYLPLITDDLAEALPDDNHADIENKVSSYAMAGGYYSGVFGLLVSVAIIIAAGGTEEGASEYVVASAFRWCVVWSGLFWLVGSFLTIPRLGNRPGKDGAGLPWYHTAQAFWRTISWTYTELPVTFRYLVLYFLYSDGFSTISGLGLIYVRLDMCATTSQLLIIAIEAPLCAAFGNFLFLRLSKMLEQSNRNMVVIVLGIIAFLPFWGLLGYVTDAIGFRSMWEGYLLGAYFGFCLGAIQNFTRTFFCELIPKSRESEFFSFYELTDKGSSWLGPMVVSGLASTGTLRLAFAYILFMTAVPAFFLWKLDVEAGKAAVAAVDAKSKEKADPSSVGLEMASIKDGAPIVVD